MSPPTRTIDARSDRVAQGTVGVLLLGGFVFRLPWLVPVVGVLLVAGAVAGPEANVFQLAYSRLVVPRLPPADARVDVATARAQDALLAGLCAAAMLAYLFAASVGWLVVIVAAIVAIIAATARIHLGEYVLSRFL